MTRRKGTDYLRFRALEAVPVLRAAAARGLGRAVDRAADFVTGRAVRGRDTAPRGDAAVFAAAGLGAAAGSRVSAAGRPFPSAGCGARCTGVKRIWSPMA